MSIDIRVSNSDEGQFVVFHDASKGVGMVVQVHPSDVPGAICETEEIDGPLYARVMTKVFPESLRPLTR